MPTRLTFGVELEFSFATIQPGTPDPEPHLPQPVFVLYGDFENWFHRKYVVFDAIVAELVAAGLPAQSVKRHNDLEATSIVCSQSSSSGPSRYQDDGVGWIPSRKHRWVWGELPWNTSSERGSADNGSQQSKRGSEGEGDEGAVGQGERRSGSEGGSEELNQSENRPDSEGNDGELEKGKKRHSGEGSNEESKQGERRSDNEGSDGEKKEENLGFQVNNPPQRSSQEEYGPEWRVSDDMSIEPSHPRAYDWIPIEVQSPPYIFSPSALEAIKLACHTLTHNFRLQVNTTTGLHVHIGDGEHSAPYSTLRNLLAFLWVFEPQIDQLHPQRRPGTPGDPAYDQAPASWYESLRRGSRLARGEHDASYERPKTVLAGLTAIYALGDGRADPTRLYDLLRATSWKSAYHLGHVAYPVSDETIKRTVEFRQHAGSLDGERIAQWVRTLVGIVEFVDEVDGLKLLQFLVAAAEVEDGYVEREDGQDYKPLQYDIVQLLRDIGLQECADYWDMTIPVAQRIMPTPYHWSPRKPVRKQPEKG